MERPSNLHVTIVFKGVEASDAIKDYATQRATKLTKHLHEMVNCHFSFGTERGESVAQLHVNAGDFDAKSDARGENLFSAIDDATEKALHQSRKHKEKATDHKRWEAREANEIQTPEVTEADE